MGIHPKILLVVFAAILFCHPAYPAEQFGTVNDLSGSAVVSDQSGQSAAVAVGTKIFEEQTINSGPDGEVIIITEDGAILAVRPDTVFHVDEYKAEGGSADKIFMSLFRGAIRSITGWIGKHNPSSYLITTPTATIGIRGTDHETVVVDKDDGDQPGTYDTVNSGSTVLTTLQGKIEVKPGNFAFAPRDRPMAPVLLRRRPHFVALRKLRIEQRVGQRKDFLRGRLEQMRKTRIQKMRTIRERRLNQNRKPGRAGERRGDLRQNRLQQDEKRHEVRSRMERHREMMR